MNFVNITMLLTKAKKPNFLLLFLKIALYLVLKPYTLCQKNPVAGLNNIIAYSVVPISTLKEEHLVVIVDSHDIKSTLASRLQDNKTITLQDVEDTVGAINNILINLKDRRVFCCNINPLNILMKDGEFYALREFIDTYPNYYQKEQYLGSRINRMS